ncbi:MFS transporter [Streptomyces sp. NPDC087300]|uniref:MFS transporter n=1 Tax=Streptomyces sp. NPDC087300 TaxID=3365780 RepID=UPI003813BCB7
MPTRYSIRRYLAGAVAARSGDEMSGPALMLAGFALTGSAASASSLLASVTVAAAVGGPVLGVLLDRAGRPGRLLAVALALYAVGLGVILLGLGRFPFGVILLVAVLAGLLGPALSGGWTAQLPRVVAPRDGRGLDRANALDAMTFGVASLAGPALAGVVAEVAGAPAAVVVSLVLIALAVPVAWLLPVAGLAPATSPIPVTSSLPVVSPGPVTTTAPAASPLPTALPQGVTSLPPAASSGSATALLPAALPGSVPSPAPADRPQPTTPPRPAASPVPAAPPTPTDRPLPTRPHPRAPHRTHGHPLSLISELTAGARVIVGRPALARATLTSVLACVAQGLLVACVPLLGERVLGGAGRGALLLTCAAVSALAANALLARYPRAVGPDAVVRVSALVQCAGLALLLVGCRGQPGVLLVGACVVGVGEGPQLTALFAVRHREAPEHLRGQIFTTGASLKVTGFAVGAAVAGPVAARSLPGALALAVGVAGVGFLVCFVRLRSSVGRPLSSASPSSPSSASGVRES